MTFQIFDLFRLGVNAVVVDVTERFNAETLLLFPDKNKKTRHMKLYEQVNLKDSMPLVSSDTDVYSHECASSPHWCIDSVLKASDLHGLPYSCLATKVASNESKAARDYIFRSTSNFAVLETLPSRKKPQNRCFVQTERCASYSTVRNLDPKSNNAI